MSVTVHSIARYTVQVLTRKSHEQGHAYITVRLYDDDDNNRGTAVFEDYGGKEPPKPTGKYEQESVTGFFDVSYFDAFIGVLRHEKDVFLKTRWIQQGNLHTVVQVSIDTKEEIIGEFFEHAS